MCVGICVCLTEGVSICGVYVCVSLLLSCLNKTAVFNAASVTIENNPSVLSVRWNKED